MPSTRILLHFDEEPGLLLTDTALGLVDALADGSPARVTGPCGFGHEVDGTVFYTAVDQLDSSTLVNRSMTAQAIVYIDASMVGWNTIIRRGITSGDAAEWMTYKLEVKALSTTRFQVRLNWQDVASTDADPPSATFDVSGAGFVMLTAARRWISTTEVVVSYYLNGDLIGEVQSALGDIGGGSTGTTRIAEGFIGIIDELMVTDYEMCAEEVAATWDLVSSSLATGYAIIRGMLPPGLPISDDPSSRVQSDLKSIGALLGEVSSIARLSARDMLPDRAYGSVLERWEQITGRSARATDSIADRRARVLSHIRQRAGVSIEGYQTALRQVLGVDAADLEFIAFAPIILDEFDTLEAERWLTVGAGWSAFGGDLRCEVTSASDIREGLISGATYHSGRRASMYVDEPGRLRVRVAVDPSVLPDGCTAGVRLSDGVTDGHVMIGIRRAGAVYSVVREARTPAGTLVSSSTVASADVHLLTVGMTDGEFLLGAGQSKFDFAWNIDGDPVIDTDDDYTAPDNLTRIDLFVESNIASTATAADVRFNWIKVWALESKRAFWHYVYRDPALPGSYFLRDAHAIFQAMKHAHTDGTVIASRSLLCDDAESTCDRGPMGAL